MPFGSGFLVHQPNPAWNASEPVVLMVDENGKVLNEALNGQDVRAVAVWKNTVIVLRANAAVVDVLVLDSTLVITRQATVSRLDPIAYDEAFSIITHDSLKTAFALVGDVVVAIQLGNDTPMPAIIETGVRGLGLMATKPYGVIIVHDVGGIAFVSVVSEDLQRRIAPSVPLSDKCRVVEAGGSIGILAPIQDDDGMQLTIVEPSTSLTKTVTLSTSTSLASMVVVDGKPLVAAIVRDGSHDALKIFDPNESSESSVYSLDLSGELGRPLALRTCNDTILAFFSGGVLLASPDLKVLASTKQLIEMDPWSTTVTRLGDTFVVTSLQGSFLLKLDSQPFWWLVWILDVLGTYIVTLALILTIGILALKLRRQQRYINAMLELPGSGMVFTLDAAGRLVRTNERAAAVLRITPRVPMRRSFHAYMRHDGVEEIRAFLTQAYSDRRPMSEKVHVDDDDEQREYVFTAVPLFGTIGRLRGIVVTGVDITEALEKRRLVNWAQLAHDMQTNLSTIRLNAEHLSKEGSVTNQQRLKRILFQTHVLTQRVRDLVSVGRSEDLTRGHVHSAEFCTQLRHEFDPEMFPNVNFSMKLRGTMINVDRLKLSRAIRNAVENAIKALRGEPGTVEIATWSDRTYVYIRISDDGVGMDTLTLENMMKPYYTTSKDGSGTGIGTMIMQHVTHLHAGSLRVTSEPGEGTQVVFRIPHMMELSGIEHRTMSSVLS